jgi:hypothetical protein
VGKSKSLVQTGFSVGFIASALISSLGTYPDASLNNGEP